MCARAGVLAVLAVLEQIRYLSDCLMRLMYYNKCIVTNVI